MGGGGGVGCRWAGGGSWWRGVRAPRAAASSHMAHAHLSLMCRARPLTRPPACLPACLPACVPGRGLLQGVPAVARAAAVTSIHDPAFLQVCVCVLGGEGGVCALLGGRVAWGLDSGMPCGHAVLCLPALAAAHAFCLSRAMAPAVPRVASTPSPALPPLSHCVSLALPPQALAAAAVRALPHLSAADICSVVESFSGGCGGVDGWGGGGQAGR